MTEDEELAEMRAYDRRARLENVRRLVFEALFSDWDFGCETGDFDGAEYDGCDEFSRVAYLESDQGPSTRARLTVRFRPGTGAVGDAYCLTTDGSAVGEIPPERILAVAIRETEDPASEVWVERAPARHYHVIHRMALCGVPTPVDGPQGFITNRGDFVDRERGLAIAKQAGQLRKDREVHTRELFSENLW